MKLTGDAANLSLFIAMTMPQPNGASYLDLQWQHQHLQLSVERAVFWRDQRLLFLADAHFGKALTFRRAGLAVPSGQTQADADRLKRLLRQFAPSTLLILGDLMHAAPKPDDPWISALQALRAQFDQVEFAVIAGNHDRHPARVLPDWHWFEDPLEIGPFRFCHEPESKAGVYTFAGHVHPCVRVPLPTASLRLPAFCFAQDMALLPSFGSFTGGFTVQGADYQRVFVQSDHVFELLHAHRR
jgi:uncharacterized protein